MLSVGYLQENGQWKILESFVSYDEADRALDAWCDKLPFAWVDILDGALQPVE